MVIAFAQFRCFASPIVIGVTDASYLDSIVQHIQHRFALVDAALSRFRSDSELCILENNNQHCWQVSPLFYRVTDLAIRYAAATDGWFDPTVRNALEAAGYDRSIDDIAISGPGPIRQATPAGGWRTIHLDPERLRITLPPATRLDFGGIGKGFAVDDALATLPLQDIGVVLSAGGDIGVRGPSPSGGWTCDIAVDPEAPVEASVSLHKGALATSGLGRRRWQHGTTTLHHLIDPHTGLPGQVTWRYVTVAAPTCVAADVAAKVAWLRGAEGPAWLNSLGLPGRFARPNGSALITNNWPVEGSAA